MAGAYIAIGSAMSALTPAQVVAFVLAVLASFLLTALGLPLVLDFFSGFVGGGVAEALARFSILHHFDAAQRGVVEFRSVFYFVSLIGLVPWLHRAGGRCAAGRLNMSGRRFALLAAFAFALMFVAGNLIANSWFRSWRFDLTEDRLYTLSAGAKRTLDGLSEPVEFKFYYSRDAAAPFPQVQAYAARVREMLQTFRGAFARARALRRGRRRGVQRSGRCSGRGWRRSGAAVSGRRSDLFRADRCQRDRRAPHDPLVRSPSASRSWNTNSRA